MSTFATTLALVVGLASIVAPQLATAADEPRLIELRLRPVVAVDDAERIAGVDVNLVFDATSPDAAPARGPNSGDEPLRLRMPHVVSNVDTVALAIEPRASDARGALQFTAADSGDGQAAMRIWQADRSAAGRVTLSYRATITNRLGTRGAAPPFELRSDGGAFSGAGLSFLLLPDDERPRRIALRWDLSQLPAGARALSSFGAGDLELPAPLAPSRLHQAWYMAGRVGTFPREIPPRGFFAAWHGEPPFDANTMLEWTSRLHGHYARFFGEQAEPRYGVFMRRNRVNPGGGVALPQAFIATFDAPTDPEDLKLTIAHEMLHTWAPALTRPGGLVSSWFGEGLAVYYQRELPLRFELIDAARFLEDLNYHAGRLYTNALANVPNAEVPLRFWEDTRIRTIPYDRGSFYFVTVDAALRKASRNRRSLDDLMHELIARQRAGRALANSDWEELLVRELGAPALARFRAMLAGEIPVPDSDAFGPCFRRTTRALRRYELGFDPKVLVEPRRIVRGLIAGSAAERAGLRDGDEILDPVGQDRLQGDQTRELALRLLRDGREFRLSYLPRGETVKAWQWEQRPGAARARCRP